MTTPGIDVFNHHAMATLFQIRIAGQETAYAAQAARAAFDTADHLEMLLSRFRENSEISQMARLAPGETLRLSQPTFCCLQIAREMEQATRGAFSITAAALRTQPELPRWTLLADEFSVRCDSGRLEFDLGAIGKGFALDRMAEDLAEWDCESFLLVAGGSSILAGEPPPGMAGWEADLADAAPPQLLSHSSLSCSGQAVKGLHILDPRTGAPAQKRERAWVSARTAAVSDALSTACMVLDEQEISEIVTANPQWKAFLPG